MGMDCKKYKEFHRFYSEIDTYGRDNYELIILKVCEKDELLKFEQYYYDELSPTYNKVRPARSNFEHSEVRLKASKNSNTDEHVRIRTELYRTEEYKELFRNVHVNKMRSVIMTDCDRKESTFKSIQEASRYITETTNYKGVNKTSKIKAVCDGERKSAYGYTWKYEKV